MRIPPVPDDLRELVDGIREIAARYGAQAVEAARKDVPSLLDAIRIVKAAHAEAKPLIELLAPALEERFGADPDVLRTLCNAWGIGPESMWEAAERAK